MVDKTIYAALEQGTTGWLARILEPSKEPRYFTPPGYVPTMVKGALCSAIMQAYPSHQVVFVSTEKFNKLVAEAEGRILTLPENWPSLQFQIGQSVYVVASNGHIFDEIDGIKREVYSEYNVPDTYHIEYRVFGHWYRGDELSADPPAEQIVTTGALVAEDDDLFLLGDDQLP